MPEAPEVEAVARTLRPLLSGRTIRRAHVRHSVAIRPQFPTTLKKNVADTSIIGVERRGKYLLFTLDRGCLAMHFKFDGQVLWFDKSKDALAPQVHVDVAFETDRGALGFVDQRHLGRVQWLAKPEDSPGIRALGVDCFSDEFTTGRLLEICQSRPRPLKLLLMDQTRIAGIGNMYAIESLWLAGLSPRHRSDRLTPKEVRRLHKAVVSVLARALECCLDPPPDFRNPKWWFADLSGIIRVYGREEQ
ncbi:MAG: DNA-formamidopyrimidine glycosylase family protein, partial [Candidatus Acidiferrales bacterium]